MNEPILRTALAELESRRASLDQCIDGLRSLLGETIPNGEAIGERINRAAKVTRRAGKKTPVTTQRPATPGDPETVPDAARLVIAENFGKGGSFKSRDLSKAIIERWPALEEKARNGTSPCLSFLLKHGELAREGKGKAAVYTVKMIKPPSGAAITQKESSWRELRKDIETRVPDWEEHRKKD